MCSISWHLPSVLKVILRVLVVGELLIVIMVKIYAEYVLYRASEWHFTDLDKVAQAHPLRILAIIRVLGCRRVHYQCLTSVSIHLSYRRL